MKKALSLIACCALAAVLAACGGSASASAEPTVQPTAKPAATAAPEPQAAEIADSESASPMENTTLVAYFSCTGTTAGIAELIAEQANAELYPITPAQPYSSDDLNYSDDNCRANQEMNDDTARPELGGDEIDLPPYTTVYLGYPIWWGTVPRIIQTFIESSDLTGKTVYLFCTSGSSGIDKSLRDLQTLYPDINFAAGQRFSGNASAEDITAWLDGLA